MRGWDVISPAPPFDSECLKNKLSCLSRCTVPLRETVQWDPHLCELHPSLDDNDAADRSY